MVRKNNNPSSREYVYGSTAYDYKKNNVEKESLQKPKNKRVKKSKNKVKVKLKVLGIVAVLFILSFVCVGRYTAILALSTDIREQKTVVSKLQSENQNISVELAKKNNLKAIEADAINIHNMVEPTKENTFFISVNPLGDNQTKPNKESALSTMQRILGLIY
ncbi:MAG: hypothetical protein RR539_01235 [Clostridium sp.]|uniref:hypothetical protein n=1 Tax=Clostridium sp. TaxID=1506 RepID=UPI002FCCAED2